MDARRLKFLGLGSGVILSMALLVAVGVGRGGVYYLSVGEFLDDPGQASGAYRVNGKVVEGSIERLDTGMDVRFVMTDGDRTVPVSYHGIIPDTFVDRADVVVQGTLDPGGTFVAHELLAKCPSKYEAAEDGAYGDESASPKDAASRS